MAKKTYRFEITTGPKNSLDPETRIAGTILKKECPDGASMGKDFWKMCQGWLMADHSFYASDRDITVGILSCNGKTICGLCISHYGSFLKPSTFEYCMGVCDLRYPSPNNKPYDYYRLRNGIWAE